jgi:DNA polymerase I
VSNLELFDKIEELRHIKSLISNFIDASPSPDGRMRTSYSFVETGRLSSHEDELEEGTHLQNIPMYLRRMFVADSGKLMLEADKSQGEARIIAWLAHEERMKSAFRAGVDIHQFNADNLGCDRQFAKTRTHGWNYGLGAKSKEEEEARDRYFRAYPMILIWQNGVKEEVEKSRVLVNPFGRRRMFFQRKGNSLAQEAWAYMGQSTLVDDVNRSLISLFYRGEPRLEILHQNHDSVVAQCKEEDRRWAIALMKEELEQPFICGGEVLTIPVEIKVGRNWEEMEKIKCVS